LYDGKKKGMGEDGLYEEVPELVGRETGMTRFSWGKRGGHG
jgi:hypothetical protein